MPKKPHSDDELLARLDASLAEDVLTDVFTDADVAAALREAGGDPDAIGRRGAELAKEFWQKRTSRRTSSKNSSKRSIA
jgi:hypothetical protein